MARVLKNADGTYTVTTTPKEERALRRILAETAGTVPSTAAQLLEDQLTNWLLVFQNDFLNTDGPVRLQQFAALSIEKQDRVDAILKNAAP
jgi:hypothetical protein